ncbi:MAG TPA: cbb3-type cytochrome oxidase assembly protein CcoS [Pseudobdellovibrionaceae bacterium]|nr:cbb3-type cytochrome oxidase assembly protein CcoS [Pseudobdellovibrionaceae bacterium]
MEIVELLVPMSLALGLGFVIAFTAAVRLGQFDDCETPAHRMLLDADPSKKRPSGNDDSRELNFESEKNKAMSNAASAESATRVTERTTT